VIISISMTSSLITAQELTKSFGSSKAVDALSLNVHAGECFGLLGPNGAGKSTFIGMTYGIVRKSGGELRVFDLDPTTESRSIKKRMGVVTQDNALDESLTVVENMLIYAAFMGIPSHLRKSRIDDLLEYMNLSHKKNEKIQTLSGGMKRRLVFVRALLGKPELLVLDEPTTGLDPSVRHLIWGKVKELRAQGTTILLTTHYMHEAEVLCDRLAIMNIGKITAEGSPKKLIQTHTPGYIAIYSSENSLALTSIADKDPNLQMTEDSSGIYLRAGSMERLALLHKESGLVPLQIRPANLEDVFLKLTGREMTTDA
jgi:lipooligosaccharide transport system ATP-binding protein